MDPLFLFGKLEISLQYQGDFMKPELVVDYACELGENPLWHPGHKRVYWTDILRGTIYYFDPMTQQHGIHYQGEIVGGFTIQSDETFLCFMEGGAIGVLQDGEFDYVTSSIPGEESHRFNDVAADPEGRVFCGTMSNTNDQPGRLYRLDRDGSLTKVLDNVGVSNGIGFTLDHNYMYYTDTGAQTIYLFDYDQDSGELSNQRPFIQIPSEAGAPDGMTVDAEGYIWSARWGGSALYRFTPDGEEDQKIDFPAKNITSAIFGGTNLTDLYVTTAGGETKANNGEGAGALFRLDPGVKGLPEFRSRIGL